MMYVDGYLVLRELGQTMLFHETKMITHVYRYNFKLYISTLSSLQFMYI